MSWTRPQLGEDISFNKGDLSWDFPGGPVFKTSPSNAEGVGSIPGWELGSRVPHSQKTKNVNFLKSKQYYKKSKKDLR